MRLFTAFVLPEGFRQELIQVLDLCKTICPAEVKWVEPENLHFTLQFIGDTEKKSVEILQEQIRKSIENLAVFEIYTPRIELFPLKKNSIVSPRLIWILCSYKESGVEAVLKDIRRGMKELSLDFDSKPFKMHATLGRVKRNLNPDQIDKITDIEIANKRWLIRMAALFESRLHPTGPEYHIIEKYYLKDNADS